MINGVDNFESIKNRAIEQSDRPESITRKEAETMVREILIAKRRAGIPFEENLFANAVSEILEEVNGS